MKGDLTSDQLREAIQRKILINVSNAYTEGVIREIEAEVKRTIISNLGELCKAITVETLRLFHDDRYMRDELAVKIVVDMKNL